MTIEQACAIRISELIEEKGLSVEELSERSKLAKYKIEKMINCQYKGVSVNYLIAICRAFKITVKDFFEKGVFQREEGKLTFSCTRSPSKNKKL